MSCEAPLCVSDKNTNFKKEVVWYPLEKICTCSKKAKFKDKQRIINKEALAGTFRHLDTCYTAHELETRSI